MIVKEKLIAQPTYSLFSPNNVVKGCVRAVSVQATFDHPVGTNVQYEHPYYRGRTIFRAEVLVSRNLFVQVKVYTLLP